MIHRKLDNSRCDLPDEMAALYAGILAREQVSGKYRAFFFRVPGTVPILKDGKYGTLH